MFSNADVEKLHKRFFGTILQTPCILSPFLSELTGAKVYLKLENMQRTGSFKERGVLSFLLSHEDKKLAHVVTASAGNHAQAVALHAARQKITATIFMPIGTSNTKVAETERLKASVKLMGESYDEAFSNARSFADSSGIPYIHAYNDPSVILGQATVAHEIFQQVNNPAAIFCPVGGGGLIAGIAQYVANQKNFKPMLIGVRAKDFQSMAQALNKGTGDLGPAKKTIAEGIAVKAIGNLAAQICQAEQPLLFAVTDDQIQSAIMVLLERQKIVTEGAGAATVAALLSDEFRHSFAQKTVVLVISGGNIDISLLARLTAQELVKSSRLVKMSIVIKDSPGSLWALLKTVTKAAGNIVDIRHERSFASIRWNEVLVDVTVETKNETHENLMLSFLNEEGYIINTHKREFIRA